MCQIQRRLVLEAVPHANSERYQSTDHLISGIIYCYECDGHATHGSPLLPRFIKHRQCHGMQF